MNRITIALLFSTLSMYLFSQTINDTVERQVTNIKIDMLKMPTNPAFLIMNTSPSEVIEPGSLPEFFTSIQSASNNFSAFPNNYGFSVTPFWWSKKAKKLSFERDFDTLNKFTFFRTTTISGGIVKGIQDNDDLWRYGVGFQTTLLRGKISKIKKDGYLERLKEYHKMIYSDFTSFLDKDPYYRHQDSINKNLLYSMNFQDSLFQINEISQEKYLVIKDSLAKLFIKSDKEILLIRSQLGLKYAELDRTKQKEIESNTELDNKFNEMNERIGLKWDIGGGLAVNSSSNKIDSTEIYRAGFWSNLGGNLITADSSASNLAAYMLVRYLYYNEIFYSTSESVSLMNNLHTLDIGVKIQYEIIDKFSLSLESVFRTCMSDAIFENTYKINGLAQYQFAHNKLVYISIGNDFNDNSVGGPEDMIVTFGINLGFGGQVDLFDVRY